MKKRIFGRKFSRGKKGRTALLRSLIRALVASGKITTTKARAKAIQGQVDKYLARAKKGGLAWRRKILAEMGNDRQTVAALFEKAASLFAKRKSGFTRITHLARRKGDNAEMVRLEWVETIIDKQKRVIKNDVKNISTKVKRN